MKKKKRSSYQDLNYGNYIRGQWPWSIIFFVSVCLSIYLQFAYQLHDLCTSLLGDITPFFMLLTFISRFVDFLFLLKSYNFLRDRYQ